MLLPLLPLLLLACAGDPGDTAAAPDPLSWPVGEPGPYNAGYRYWEETYQPLAGEPRTIGINVWYPTEDTEGEDVLYLGSLPDALSLGGATPAAPLYGGRYPVHVHSHGSQAWGGSSADLMRYFASHGWVVIAPDHTGNTISDNLDPRPVAHYIHRPQDISVSLDALEALGEDDPLSEADTRAVVMSGHSFGCYTGWASGGAAYDEASLDDYCPELSEDGCAEDERAAFASGELADERVAAVITMAGGIRRGFFGDDGHRAAHAPFLLMSGTEDGDGIPDSWEALEGVDRSWVELEGGCHQTFALGVCSTLDPTEGFRVVDTYAMAFARGRVLGDDGAEVAGILNGEAEVSDVVTYRTGE